VLSFFVFSGLVAKVSEQTLAQINQCFVYKLPPRASSRGYRAADWNASEPLWQVRSDGFFFFFC
jgi:hypothetical protein